MSVKIVVCSLLMLLFSMAKAQIDCRGKRFICTTDVLYLLCFDDPNRNTTITVSNRSSLCPTGTICDMNGDEFCDEDPYIDCDGKIFLCPTINSFLMCTRQPDGTTRTNSTRIVACPSSSYCDQDNGSYECDSLTIPTGPSTVGSTAPTETVTETTSPDTPPIITLPTSWETESTTPETTTLETTTLETTTTEITSTETTTTEPTTLEATTTETTTLETSTIITTPRTVPTPPTAPPKLGELPGFICTEMGYFAHPTDCRRYIYCNYSFVTSSYEHNQYQCSNELIFDPSIKKCTSNTKPCEDLIFKCVVRGTFADPTNPHKYIACVPKVPSSFYEVHYTCPGEKIFDAKANACVAPSQGIEIETLSRRTLSLVQDDGDEDKEFFEESDEMVADKIYLNSNEDASVNLRNGESFKFSLV